MTVEPPEILKASAVLTLTAGRITHQA